MNTAKIPLSGKNSNGSFCIVDAEDVELVAGVKWHLSDTGYAVNRSNGKTTRMHRLINKTPDGLVTDHKNNDKLDNRKSNLRSVTQAENAKNHKYTKGYVWDKSKGRWMVRVNSRFCGRYDTEAEAIEAVRRYTSGQEYIPARRKLRYLPTGVSRLKGSRSYTAKAQINGKRHYLGTFKTVREAKIAYDNIKKEVNQ